MKFEQGAKTVVDLKYTLKNDEGEVLDEATKESPFTFLAGVGGIVPGLEEALVGMEVGAQKQVTITPDKAYGHTDPSLRITVGKDEFPEDTEFEVGSYFMTEDTEGETAVYTIISVAADEVVLDGNHPLADQTLNFDIEVVGLREPTKEELEHGHVHTEECSH